tara:strand:+ start:239 stop:394 length:156 start_codon:yes stop_codon:yes gene_type:complete
MMSKCNCTDMDFSFSAECAEPYTPKERLIAISDWLIIPEPFFKFINPFDDE